MHITYSHPMAMLNNDREENVKHGKQASTIPVVMIRHAQSQWNRENRFTGWVDPPLTQAGIAEAKHVGESLLAHGLQFDVAYSSRLLRAITTLDILLASLHQATIPRETDWRLNERHYGKLQGLDKAAATTAAGEQQVWRWRRSYQEQAAPLMRSDPSHPVNDPKYADIAPHLLPDVENLAQTRTRVTAFWREQITPRIRNGERVLISAHGNTLRALLMELAGMRVAEVESFEIPTATPIVYDFDQNARPLSWRYLEINQSMASHA
jgi:2,3-bisphosphoglycerate-dependent phosphoglycerate mutase